MADSGIQMTEHDIKTERDAERFVKKHIIENDIDEFIITLEGDAMDNYVYKLVLKKTGWDDIESVTYGKDDPDNAYILGCKDICMNATLKSLGV